MTRNCGSLSRNRRSREGGGAGGRNLGGIRCLCLRLFSLALALAFVAGRVEAAGTDVVYERGVPYCTKAATKLALDLARPAGAGPFPTVVFIHGGGWIGGNRGVYEGEIRELAATRGYAAASIDYRLMAPDRSGVATQPWPAQIDDVRCAIRFLRANASRFAIDPERIGATGHSAGGHLSLLLGLEEPNRPPDAEWPDASSRVQAVVNQAGPTDLVTLFAASEKLGSLGRMLLPGPVASFGARAERASPVFYASPDDPPVLTLHGDLDDVVPVSQARALDAALRKVGVAHELVVLPGVKHAFGRQTADANRERIYAFFARVLR